MILTQRSIEIDHRRNLHGFRNEHCGRRGDRAGRRVSGWASGRQACFEVSGCCSDMSELLITV